MSQKRGRIYLPTYPQVGRGMAYYAGFKRQRGHGRNQIGRGFFGRFFRDHLLPFLRYAGRQALDLGANIVKDIASGDSNIKDSISKRGRKKKEEVIMDAMDYLERARKQTGSGRKRKVMRGAGKPKNTSRKKNIKGKKKVKRTSKQKKPLKKKKRNSSKERISELKKSLLAYAKENL